MPHYSESRIDGYGSKVMVVSFLQKTGTNAYFQRLSIQKPMEKKMMKPITGLQAGMF
jgi:hypothetical protein